jgi:hypothetical protein
VAALLLFPAGCASERQRVQETEQMLIAAGFPAERANIPEKEAQLRALPPHQLLAQPIEIAGQPTTGYVYRRPGRAIASLSATRRRSRPSTRRR